LNHLKYNQEQQHGLYVSLRFFLWVLDIHLRFPLISNRKFIKIIFTLSIFFYESLAEFGKLSIKLENKKKNPYIPPLAAIFCEIP
jgi:hypothetical protein